MCSVNQLKAFLPNEIVVSFKETYISRGTFKRVTASYHYVKEDLKQLCERKTVSGRPCDCKSFNQREFRIPNI